MSAVKLVAKRVMKIKVDGESNKRQDREVGNKMTNSEQDKKTLIACVGNLLLQDEGFGPYMAKVLTDIDTARKHFDEEHAQFLMDTFRPDEVEAPDDGRIPVLDAGTMGMSMVPYIRDYDRIIVVDIIDCKNPKIAPGSVFVLTPEDMAEKTVMHSLHDLRVIDVINNASFAGYTADFSCVCIQAKCYDPQDFYIGLSPELEEKVPVVMGAIFECLGIDAQ